MKVKFYLLGSGRSPVEDFLEEQSEEIRTDFVDAVNLLASGRILSIEIEMILKRIREV